MPEQHNPGRPVVAFITLGCKANRYDSSAMMAMIPESEYRVIDDAGAINGPIHADVYVINTCAVTAKSSFQSRQMVRRARKWNPDARIIASGCVAQIDPGSLLNTGADLAFGVDERDKAIAALGPAPGHTGPVFFHPEAGLQNRARAVVKIQDGCDFKCAYCVVTIARGPSRSLPHEDVLSQLRAVAQKGFSEAVLTGVHIGLYGKDHDSSLIELLRSIESEPGMPARIRLSSIEPQELTDELINIIASSSRICPHLHVPLQSGDPEVLKRMNRPYGPEPFEERINRAIGSIPGMGLGLDIIAGFPGETEQQHRSTVELLNRLPVSYLHVFPFSKRPGTPAASMTGQVIDRLIKQRTSELRRIGAQKKLDFLKTHVGRTVMVLAEEWEGGEVVGTSAQYIKVRFKGSQDRIGTIVPVDVERAEPSYVIGHEVVR